MWKAVLACTLAAVIVFAAEKKEGDGLRSSGDGPQFRAQLGQRLSTQDDSLQLFVAVSVPYDNLVFLRADSGFNASFELVIALADSAGALMTKHIRNIRVETLTYAETNSRTKNAIHAEEFIVAPGEYSIRVTMTDQTEVRRKSKWEGKTTLASSDRGFVSPTFSGSRKTQDSFAQLGVPRLVESFYSSEDSAHARIQLYSNGSDSLRLVWSLIAEAGDTVRSDAHFLSAAHEVQLADYVLHIGDLTAQTYTLSVLVAANGRSETHSRRFSVRLPGIPPSITSITEAIRQLKYIATAAESKQLRQAEPRDRETLFRDFWKRRDPSPNTEQNELLDKYYLRVQFSDENFGTNRAGWETDRGRIYIIYGPPTDIERHPFEADSRPYEIWYYSQAARRFVFVDYTGFGDYTLIGPEWGY